MSEKRKLAADGIFKTKLNKFFTWEVTEDGYSGVEAQVTYQPGQKLLS